MEHLSQITTQWTEMEGLLKKGPAALAEYLAAYYFEILAIKFRQYRSGIDDLQAHELASDVIFEFLKNDYSLTLRLNRDKGRLRGLFFKIIKSKLFKLNKEKHPFSLKDIDIEEQLERDSDVWTDFSLDFKNALEKFEQKKTSLYNTFFQHYLAGMSIKDIAHLEQLEENAVKNRLYNARRYLKELLSHY